MDRRGASLWSPQTPWWTPLRVRSPSNPMTYKPTRGTTRAEIETTFRWDHEDQILSAGTTSHQVANRWTKGGLPVMVIGRTKEGTPHSWALDIPWTGRRGDWMKVVRSAIPQFGSPPAAKQGEGV